MSSVRCLFTIYCGCTTVDKGILTYHVDVGKMFDIRFSTFLIKTDKGNILFDSGIDHDDIPHMLSTGKKLDIKKEDHLVTRLKEVGVTPGDIDFIFQSHLHWDHSGLLKAFPNAKIIIQREEYSYAMNSPYFADVYYRHIYYDSPNLNWQIIDGDENLMPGVTAITTPGHTPGHQSLLLELPKSGTIILSGDCAHLSENIEKGIISGIFVDPIQALHSLKKIKILAQITKAQIFLSHDIQQYKTMKKPPESYT